MKISVRAFIEGAEGETAAPVTLAVIERDAGGDPASGLGLFIAETHNVLRQLQTVVLKEQVAQFTRRAARCLACGLALGIKDSKNIVYRTAFGKATLESPRFYSRCSGCGFGSSDHATLSPLARSLRERIHPQWAWLQCRYASVMSYRLAQIFLRDAFPGGAALPASSLKLNVQEVGARLEQETRLATAAVASNLSSAQAIPLTGPPLELQVDAGYIKTRAPVGSGWIPVVASKLVRPDGSRGYTHAYATNTDRRQGLRQQAFLQGLGVSPQSPITVISDGGDDISLACKLPSATLRILDWFHIGMRFEQLSNAVAGIEGLDADAKALTLRQVVSAKRHLWHGRQNDCLKGLECLRRETGWVGANNALGKLIRYLRGCSRMLINYALRRSKGLSISSAGAESAVDFVVGQRMKRNGHMRWTRAGANSLLQVRCAVRNGQDVRNFKRWYPPNQRIAGISDSASLS